MSSSPDLGGAGGVVGTPGSEQPLDPVLPPGVVVTPANTLLQDDCLSKRQMANPFFGGTKATDRGAILIGVIIFLYVVFAWLFYKTMLERGAPISRTYGFTISLILFLSYAMAFICFFEMGFAPDWCVGFVEPEALTNLDPEGLKPSLSQQVWEKGLFKTWDVGQGWIWIAGLVGIAGVSFMLSMMPTARASRAHYEEAD
jgi:hypothetical protein